MYSSTPVMPELCIHVLPKHVIKGTFSQILTLEVASHLLMYSRVVRAGLLGNIYPIKIRDSIEFV